MLQLVFITGPHDLGRLEPYWYNYQMSKLMKISFWLGIITILGLLFQAGHFIEHITQFGVWLFGPKNAMYMTPWATSLVDWIGTFFDTTRTIGQSRLIGVEILHLVGNSIFLIAICSYYYFNKTKHVRKAFWWQVFHVFEHILLTTSIFVFGKSLGFSSLFGLNTSILFSIGFRIIFHFVINLIPSIYILKAILGKNKSNK